MWRMSRLSATRALTRPRAMLRSSAMAEPTNESLEARIAQLEAENESLRSQVTALELERTTLQETLWAHARSSRPPPPKVSA